MHVERQKETVTVEALKSQMTPLKMIRTKLVSIIFRPFGRCFGLFVTSELLLLPFLSVAPHALGTRNALLGSRLYNTEVYLTTIISIQNHTVTR
jgi:hypothetical protein